MDSYRPLEKQSVGIGGIMSEQVQERWNYQIRDGFRCVALSRDGRFIFGGGEDEHLYCFERSGDLLWRSSIEGIPTCIAVADGCERIIVGCDSGKAYLWNYLGLPLYTFEASGIILGARITPSAHRMALYTASSLTHHSISLFDSMGSLLWTHTLRAFIRRFSITSDGQAIVLGSDDHHIYLFNDQGQIAWSYDTGASVWAGAQSADTTAAIVAGSNDYHVYLFGSFGRIRWSYNTEGDVNAIAITPDGRFVGAICNSKVMFLFNDAGDLLWKYNTIEDNYGLLLSEDGHFVLARSRANTLTLLDSTGKDQWIQPMHQKISDIAMTPNGRLLAIAQGTSIVMYENLLAPEDMSDARLVQNVLSQIHRAYGISPYQGITTWFEMFDHALLCRQLDLCRELIQEIHSSNYHLSTAERDAVTSREGSFLLYQGLKHQQHGETEQAERAYEQSYEIQNRLHFQFGAGHARSALHTLKNAKDEIDPVLHSLLVNPPELLGSSQRLLAQRFGSLSPVDQYHAVQVAKQKGYLIPLLEALSSPYPHVQASAAMALAWLQPGLETSKLTDLLTDTHWIVRWQAGHILAERAKELESFAPHREQVRLAVRVCLSKEPDPFVRQTLIMLLSTIGDTTFETTLVKLLEDTDPDVRFAAIKTLGLVGTRQTITSLSQVASGKDSAGHRITDFAQLAIQRIRQRHPLTQVLRVVFCQELAEQHQPVKPTTCFLTQNPVIHCVVTLAHPTFGTRISCKVKSDGQTPLEQVKRLKYPLLQRSSSNGRYSLKNWLHQLIAEEDEAFWAWRDNAEESNEMPSTTQVFSFTQPRSTWSAGLYSVEIALDDEVQYKHTFQVINFEAMRAAPIYFAKGSLSYEQKRYQEALVDYVQALKFQPSHISALCSKGDVLIVRGLLQEAGDAYSHALQLDPNAVLFHFCSEGLLHLLELNHYEGVLTSISLALLHVLDPSVQTDPCPQLTDIIKAAEIATLEGKEPAFMHIEEVIQHDPSSVPDLLAKAIALAFLERRDDALIDLKRTLDPLPNSSVTTAIKAIGLAYLKQREEALSILDQALFLSPSSVFLNAAKALTLMLLERKEDALAIIDQALRIEPGLIMLYIFREFLLFQLDRLEEILATSERMLRLDSNSPLAILIKGVALLLLERDEGFFVVQQIIDANPNFLLAHFMGVVTMNSHGRSREALTITEQIIQRLPNSAFVYYLQGESQMVLKRYAEAVSAYDRAIQLGLNFARLHSKKGEALNHVKSV